MKESVLDAVYMVGKQRKRIEELEGVICAIRDALVMNEDDDSVRASVMAERVLYPERFKEENRNG
jgi:hypothetical protein